MKSKDGYLKVKTKLDNATLEKNLNQAKKDLVKFKNDAEKLTNKKLKIEAELNLNDAEYQRKIKEIERRRGNELKANTNSRGYIDSGTELKINTKYDNQIANLGLKMENSISKADYQLGKIEDQLNQNTLKQKELNSAIDDMNTKLQESKDEENRILNSTEGIGKSITGVIKKVAKWTLAVFGIRTAYNAIRSAMGVLTQYNKQMASDIEYIQFALATVLQPVIEGIIKLVYTLLSYVNYLAKAWFNVNLFANAGAKAFESMKKSSGETAKNAKDIEKSTTGFDDLNILEDNKTENNNSTSIVAPSVDLGNIENCQPPKWLETIKDWGQWIIDHWQLVLGIIGATGAVFLAIKLGSFLSNLKKIKKETGGVSSAFQGFFDGLGKATEAIAILGGLTLVIQSITSLIDTFSQSGLTLGEVAGLLGIVLGELAIAFGILLGAMTLMTPSWQSIAAAAVIFGGFALVIHEVTELIDTFSESGLNVSDVAILMASVFTPLIALMGAIVTLGPAMTAGLLPFSILAAEISAILIVVSLTLPVILDACAKFINDIGPFVIKLITTINDGINKTIYALGTVLPPIIQSVGDLFTKIFGGVSKVIETVGNVIVNILNTAKSLVTTVLSSILNFINQLGPAINNFVDGAILAVTKLINFLISGIEYMVNTLIIDSINNLISAVNNIPLVDVPKLPRVNIPRFKPILMAGGGIIDVPKKGVPLASNVVGGEAGAEGVLPLENPDTMARLGREIGQWISINLDLTNTIDGRVLNRRLEAIKNDNHFARNGGF